MKTTGTDHLVVIPSSRKPERVAGNVAAADIAPTEADRARTDEFLPHAGVGRRGGF